jgi:hypothetical protein
MEGRMACCAAVQHLIQEHAIRLGRKSKHVVPAILAVFASDVQSLDSTQSDLKLISSFHYWLSLRLYEEKLKGIQEEDLYAIFTCGIIHIMMVIKCAILDVTAGIDMLNGFDNVLLASS